MSYHSYTNSNAVRITSIYKKTKAYISFYENFLDRQCRELRGVSWVDDSGRERYMSFLRRREKRHFNQCGCVRESDGWMNVFSIYIKICGFWDVMESQEAREKVSEYSDKNYTKEGPALILLRMTRMPHSSGLKWIGPRNIIGFSII